MFQYIFFFLNKNLISTKPKFDFETLIEMKISISIKITNSSSEVTKVAKVGQ